MSRATQEQLPPTVMTRMTVNARQHFKQIAAYRNETLIDTLSRIADAEWNRMMRDHATTQEIATDDQ